MGTPFVYPETAGMRRHESAAPDDTQAVRQVGGARPVRDLASAARHLASAGLRK